MKKNKYAQLMGNTLIFAIGTFASKILVFLMMRYYTAVLSTSDFGISDLITQAANVLIPIATVSITSGVIRFGLVKANDKREIFSIGVVTVLCGYAILLLFSPLLGKIDVLSPYLVLIYLYVLTSSLQQVCHQFVRARGHVRLYALDGIFRTVCTIVFNVLFLSVFGLGITGYVLSIIVADALSIVALSAIDGLPRFFRLRYLNPVMARSMLAYSLPLIFATECNWIISMSDRFFIEAMRSSHELGLYAVSSRIPTIMILISSIFIDAWQISTINGSSRKEQEDFFTTVGNIYQALVVVLVSGIILFSKVFVFLFAAPSYYEAWTFIPLLVIGSGFACLSNFVNSVYTLEKKSTCTMATVVLGAIVNIGLNILMIPSYGPQGAALATAISYILMFLIRAIHSRRYITLRWEYLRFVVSGLVLVLQCFFMLREVPLWIPIEILLFATIVVLNGDDIWRAVCKILRRAVPRPRARS